MDKKTRKAQVVLAVIDHDRQSFTFLLLKTNKKRGEFWQNVTGKIEANETYEEGALREAIEETGLKIDSIVDILDLNLEHDFIDNRKRAVHEKSFLIVLDQAWDVKIDSKEHQEFKWVTFKDLSDDLVKYQGNYEALQMSVLLLKHRSL
jgi:dihydroneopterin triphosphate diphosphatase